MVLGSKVRLVLPTAKTKFLALAWAIRPAVKRRRAKIMVGSGVV
jgi:hypothetical protein